MLHHLSFAVSDLVKASTLYDAALAPLGYRRVNEADGFVGYGIEQDKDMFALKTITRDVVAPGPGFHLAFTAPNREAVDAFYVAALSHGAKDNGAPGLRAHYGPDYYAAFVYDLDGYLIEAVITVPV